MRWRRERNRRDDGEHGRNTYSSPLVTVSMEHFDFSTRPRKNADQPVIAANCIHSAHMWTASQVVRGRVVPHQKNLKVQAYNFSPIVKNLNGVGLIHDADKGYRCGEKTHCVLATRREYGRFREVASKQLSPFRSSLFLLGIVAKGTVILRNNGEKLESLFGTPDDDRLRTHESISLSPDFFSSTILPQQCGTFQNGKRAMHTIILPRTALNSAIVRFTGERPDHPTLNPEGSY